MNRSNLLSQLALYVPMDHIESEMKDQLIAFILRENNCYSNESPHGHITGSAWVVDISRKKIALVYHAKLQKWLQPG